MLEEVDDADGMSYLPAILERDFRCDILQPGVKVDLSFFMQFQQCQRDKCLADRAHAEFRVATDGTIRGNVRLADSTAPQDLAICDQRYSCPRYVLFVENVLHCFLQFLDRFRVCQLLFRLGCTRGREARQRSRKEK